MCHFFSKSKMTDRVKYWSTFFSKCNFNLNWIHTKNSNLEVFLFNLTRNKICACGHFFIFISSRDEMALWWILPEMKEGEIFILECCWMFIPNFFLRQMNSFIGPSWQRERGTKTASFAQNGKLDYPSPEWANQSNF